MTDLQHALDLARSARAEDDKGNYAAAFSAYRRCVDYFVRVIRTEPNDLIRASLTKTARTYISRAELLKDFLAKSRASPTTGQSGNDSSLIDEEVFEVQEDMGEITLEQTASEGFETKPSDPRIGPLVKEKTTTFWNDSGDLLFRVTIGHNMVVRNSQLPVTFHLENKSSIAVASIKVYIEEIDISTQPNKQGLVQSEMYTRQLNKCEYVKKNIFPLSNATYNGTVLFEIPAYAKLTEVDHSSTFAREHLLRAQIHIPRHKNLVLDFPIRIMPDAS